MSVYKRKSCTCTGRIALIGLILALKQMAIQYSIWRIHSAFPIKQPGKDCPSSQLCPCPSASKNFPWKHGSVGWGWPRTYWWPEIQINYVQNVGSYRLGGNWHSGSLKNFTQFKRLSASSFWLRTNIYVLW
jgi:hypothetical protein